LLTKGKKEKAVSCSGPKKKRNLGLVPSKDRSFPFTRAGNEKARTNSKEKKKTEREGDRGGGKGDIFSQGKKTAGVHGEMRRPKEQKSRRIVL